MQDDYFPPVLNPYEEIAIHGAHLPHWEQENVCYFVTWRLADALPPDKVSEWMYARDVWLKAHPQPWTEATAREYRQNFTGKLDAWLDCGYGACLLNKTIPRKIVCDALLHFDNERYNMLSFVVMPNHVHVLFAIFPTFDLSKTLQSWKSFTAKAINGELGISGKVWQENYWDRIIRNQKHFDRCVDYIKENPHKANLSKCTFTLYVSDKIKDGE